MNSNTIVIKRISHQNHLGFTLVEMLVAMAVTLLMMAALARSFGYIGEQVRDGRGNMQLANELRGVTTRISDELKRCTVSLKPSDGGLDQPGYFMYYEGPVTDVTSSIFRASTDADGNIELPDSRYGDFDDYIAFTAVAPPNAWFTGKVPRYLLEAKSAEVKGTAFAYQDNDAAAFEPVVVKSKYAEIIYFASPEYIETTLGTATPQYIDVDGDSNLVSGSAIENGLPDRLRIYRRVLLIRPDLNVDPAVLQPLATGSDLTIAATDPPHLPRLLQDDGVPSPDVDATFMQPDTVAANWNVALAPVHQQCDLSIRRVLDATGNPTALVAANSLADLAIPHNRFAHVRIPGTTLGVGGATATSMPVLSLGPPASILGMVNQNSPTADRIAPQLGPNTASNDPVVTPNNWCGFLRPEFVLGLDRFHPNPSDASWSWSARMGEDLLVNNAVAFDVQIYDPTAFWIADASSGLVVGPGDAGYRGVLNASLIDLSLPADASRATTGGFVDLAYTSLAGGSLRGWTARTVDRRSTSSSDSSAILSAPFPGNRGFLVSAFSGILMTSNNANDAYRPSLYHSGKLVVNGTNQIRLFQPTYDTYTSAYERDGLLQNSRYTPSTDIYEGTLWTTTVGGDLGANGIDDDATSVPSPVPPYLLGVDGASERETSAPFDVQAEAIRVTVRLENPSTRQVRQSSVIYRDNR